MLVHAEGTLGLVENALVLASVLLAGHLVHGGLSSALLAIGDCVTGRRLAECCEDGRREKLTEQPCLLHR